MAGYDFAVGGDLLRSGIYIVPNFQRNYAWQMQQLNDLWEDLDNIDLESQSKHFTGNIVAKALDEIVKLGKTFKRFEVIDGQQRLATLTILLYCICEELRDLPSGEARVTADNVADGCIQDTSTGAFKIILNGGDDQFLKDVILKPQAGEMTARQPETPSEKRLANAKTFFAGKLRRASFEALNALLQKILTRLLFIRYEVDSDVEAGLIFEAMNDRGISLMQLDKIKNYLIYLAYRKDDPDFATVINQSWGDIFRNVMGTDGSDEDVLLRYHWIMLTGESKEYNIHRRLKQRYALPADDVLDKAKRYVESLKEASYVFRELRNTATAFADIDTPLAEEIRGHLDGLQRLRKMATFMPLLMASRIVCKDSPHLLRDICQACESFAFRVYAVNHNRSDTGVAAFHSKARSLYSFRGDSDDIRLICEGIVAEISLRSWEKIFDSDFREYLGRIDMYNAFTVAELRYILYEYEKARCAGQGESPPTWENVQGTTIEHIWPRKPRNFDTWSDKRRQQHASCVNKLGNLTLTFWNPQLSNKDFVEKKKKYAESNLAIQRELNHKRTWGVKTIVDRTEEIVAFALKRWPQ